MRVLRNRHLKSRETFGSLPPSEGDEAIADLHGIMSPRHTAAIKEEEETRPIDPTLAPPSNTLIESGVAGLMTVYRPDWPCSDFWIFAQVSRSVTIRLKTSFPSELSGSTQK